MRRSSKRVSLKALNLTVMTSKEKHQGSRVTKTITINLHPNPFLCLAKLATYNRLGPNASQSTPVPTNTALGATLNMQPDISVNNVLVDDGFWYNTE
ncbi:hypothetical protein CU097_011862 [Rhizopus azygosporus]|uniref:Uncharacterized protein n=1 Tax=Rhizopus azygosporus TaxID=86630 RepID=A0A367JPP8_RHIAZ|nr:hypothetical protein CU097_011862 [Rhizopus azygosporus]